MFFYEHVYLQKSFFINIIHVKNLLSCTQIVIFLNSPILVSYIIQMIKPNLKNISFKSLFGFIVGPGLFFWIIFFLDLEPGKPSVTYTLAIAILMAIWWITEVIPLAITALLPVVLFPLFGVMNGKDVSSTYFNHVIFLFIGGFLVALAMQKWDLHKRIAIRILLITGSSPARILLGFMLATSFLSM